MNNLTKKQLYCIAMTLQTQMFDVKLNTNDCGHTECFMCKYKAECYDVDDEGNIKKYRHGFREMLKSLQSATGVYLGY